MYIKLSVIWNLMMECVPFLCIWNEINLIRQFLCRWKISPAHFVYIFFFSQFLRCDKIYIFLRFLFSFCCSILVLSSYSFYYSLLFFTLPALLLLCEPAFSFLFLCVLLLIEIKKIESRNRSEKTSRRITNKNCSFAHSFLIWMKNNEKQSSKDHDNEYWEWKKTNKIKRLRQR